MSYNVLISQPQFEGDAVEVLSVTELVDRFLHITGLNNSLPDVTITVTAVDRVGQRNGSVFFVQLPRSLGKCFTYRHKISKCIAVYMYYVHAYV